MALISPDTLQDIAVQVAREVARSQGPALESLGRRVAAQAIFSVTDPLPGPIRTFIQPGYTKPPPQPTWVKNTLEPFISPMLSGAKAEALKTARRVSKPLYIGMIGGLLTVFALGYMVGSKQCKVQRPSRRIEASAS